MTVWFRFLVLIASAAIGFVAAGRCAQAAGGAKWGRRVAPALVTERTLGINGPIGGRMAFAVANSVARLASQDSRDPIQLVINSPGGSVEAGMFIVSAVELAKARGFKIQCYVPGFAASMAFQILAHCDERYVLRNSYLLWHPVRASIRAALTATEAAILAGDLAETETMLIDDLRSRFKVSDEFFHRHYVAETLWNAERLAAQTGAWLKVVDDIPGVTRVFPMPLYVDPGAEVDGDEDALIPKPWDIVYKCSACTE